MPAPEVVAGACIGRLGLFGNAVFQYTALKLAAELHGARFLLPPWPAGSVFAETASDAVLEPELEASLPLVADRPVLSHAGWRAWAATREPLASAGAVLSGVAVRRLLPQVNAELLLPTSRLPCAAAAYWGWFQFSTSAFALHKRRFTQLLAPRTEVEPLLQAVIDTAGHGQPLHGIHLRCGEGFTALEDDSPVAAPAECWSPPDGLLHNSLAASTTGAWRDEGVFWSAPEGWYCEDLQRRPEQPVLLFTDGKAPLTALRALGARTPAEAAPHQYAALVAGLGGGELAATQADWLLMTRCGSLAISNSTFSFSASMLASARAPGCDFDAMMRPCPLARMLVPFDPWDSQPTLKKPPSA